MYPHDVVQIVDDEPAFPPILVGNWTPSVQQRTTDFRLSIADLFERWVTRHQSLNTQRAYRQAVMDFVAFQRIVWPESSSNLLQVRVADVQRYRDDLIKRNAAPEARNHRISAVSGFFTYLREAATELRLPINVPNPAHSQFIARESDDPVAETPALTVAEARRLLTLPVGHHIIDLRDRAILAFYLYSGARISTGCALQVDDFVWNNADPTIRLLEKGDRRRTIGLHYHAALAIREYLSHDASFAGSLFRPRLNSRSRRLGRGSMSRSTMYRLLQSYLERLPDSVRIRTDPHTGTLRRQCRFTPHSLRATTATLLLDAGVDICKVQELLGHRHITTTQIYDKRRRRTSQGASHDLPI